MLFAFLFATKQSVYPIIIQPPAIAHAAGITLGLTTVDQFVRRHAIGWIADHVYVIDDKGRPEGDGPLATLGWNDATSKTSISVAPTGQVIDRFDVEWPPDMPFQPTTHLDKSELGFLANLHKGMSRKQVETAFHTRLFGSQIERTGLIQYPDRTSKKHNDRYTQWKIHFTFGPKGLQGFEGSAD